MIRTLILFVLFLIPQTTFSKVQGKGGSFLDLHTSSVSTFSSNIAGTPLVLGGMGCVHISSEICVGGAGGGGFLARSQYAEFQMGYGALYGEYRLLDWLNARMFAGGGGHKVLRTLAENKSQVLSQKIAANNFWLLHPTLSAQWKPASWLTLGGNAGYFIATVSELNSPTLGITVLMGGDW